MKAKCLIITDEPEVLALDKDEDRIQIIAPEDYIDRKQIAALGSLRDAKIINLCSDYEYLSMGYYCSLLAEARGHRCIPSVNNMIALNWKRLTQAAIPELNAILAKHYKPADSDEIGRTFLVYFGRCEKDEMEPLARRLFDLFRMPLLSCQIKLNGKGWTIKEIEPMALSDLPIEKHKVFNKFLMQYLGRAWITPKQSTAPKFWLATLMNPEEKMPPSDKGALDMLIKTGKKMNITVDLITKDDMATLLEYDALFIRETTAIDHHTFRIAHKAEQEGIPVIDDTRSIIRCANKVFLAELLDGTELKMPETMIIDRKLSKLIEKSLEFPVIIKVPDGSFSRGVVKAANVTEYREKTAKLFADSDILLIQEFVPSDFDWRIGVLNGEPLFACKYFMARGHWQIYNHDHKKKKVEAGTFETVSIEQAPKAVVNAALKACAQIGRGLYGVDLKEREDGIYIIEVNDNPNIDRGVEDKYLGEELYVRILNHFQKMIDEGYKGNALEAPMPKEKDRLKTAAA